MIILKLPKTGTSSEIGDLPGIGKGTPKKGINICIDQRPPLENLTWPSSHEVPVYFKVDGEIGYRYDLNVRGWIIISKI